MNEKEEILKNSAKEYFELGEYAIKKNKLNSAVVLFFKSLIALTDPYIFQNLSITPSSHANRFKILKEKFPEVYDIVDKDFPFYQDSYVHSMSKELGEVIKDDVKILAKKTETEI